jgi:hypothetical protein
MGKSSRRARARAHPNSNFSAMRAHGVLPAAPLALPIQTFDFGDTKLPPEYEKITNCEIHNITLIKPSKAVKKVISLGGKNRFPTDDASNDTIMENFGTFCRSVRCTQRFTDEPPNPDDRFQVKNATWQPPTANFCVEKWLKTLKMDLYDQLSSVPIKKKGRKAPWYERVITTITNMCSHFEAMITNTDKNLGLILLYKHQYNRMCLEHLRDTTSYQLLPLVYVRQNNYPDPLHPLHQYHDTTSTLASSLINGIFTSFKQSLFRFDMLFNNKKKDYDTLPKRTAILNESLFFIEEKDGIQIQHARTIAIPLIWDCLSTIARFVLQLEYAIDLIRMSLFYILPKMHKGHKSLDDIKGRPIVSCVNSPTFHASKYVDIILQELVKILDNNLKDSNELLLLIHGVKFDPNIWFLTADVTALYPSINIQDGLDMVRKIMTDNLDKGIPNLSTLAHVEHLIDFMKLVLNQNYVVFGDRTLLQIQGTAMGTPLAVVFANLYMTGLHLQCLEICKTLKNVNPFVNVMPPLSSSEFKKQLEFDFDKENLCFTLSEKSKLDYPDIDLSPGADHKSFSDSLLNKRFIDDICSVWSDQFAPLIYITVFNTLNKYIKLTYDISFDEAVMMDIKLFKGKNFTDDTGFIPYFYANTLDSVLYQKPTNLFLHLPYQSYHDSYEPVVVSERNRTCLCCSDEWDFRDFDDRYKLQLFSRGYPAALLDKWFASSPNREKLIDALLTKRQNPAPKMKKNMILYKMLRCSRNLNLKFSTLFRIPRIVKKTRNSFNNHVFPHKVTICKSSGRNLKSYLCSARCKDKFTDVQFLQV